MVTVTPPLPRRRLPAVRRLRRRTAAAAALALGLALSGLLAAPAAAQTDTLYFLTAKRLAQQPSGDTLVEALEQQHGPLTEDRGVTVSGAELDIYGISASRTGLGIGLELQHYEKELAFRDPTMVLPPRTLDMTVRTVLFTLKAYLRLGSFYPFLGAGLGNAYLKLDDSASSGPQLSNTAESVSNVRAGFRWLMLGRLGLLGEVGRTRARLEVDLDPATPNETLELGGTYRGAGVFWVF